MSAKEIIELVSTIGMIIILILVFGGDAIVEIIREIEKKNHDDN